MCQQVSYNIAWQHFEEINDENDTERLIDITGLSVVDAEAIVKQKIYDLASSIRVQPQSFKSEERIMVIVCSEDHVEPLYSKYTGKQ